MTWETKFCFFAAHEVGVLPRKMHNHVVDFWSNVSPIQLESMYATRLMSVGAMRRSLDEVAFMYQTMHFRRRKWRLSGRYMFWHILFTTNAKFSLVIIRCYKAPTSWWYCFESWYSWVSSAWVECFMVLGFGKRVAILHASSTKNVLGISFLVKNTTFWCKYDLYS